MAKWSLRATENISDDFYPNLHPLVAKILFNKGLKTEDEVRRFVLPDYGTDSYDPFLFGDMEKAVKRIRKARDNKERVVIFGDYDADGITSSAILKETFDACGIDSFVYIPDKRSEGYGMNIAAIEGFKEKGVNLVVTVDCGITGVAETAQAKALGMDVIITDHHHVPEQLPDALAIINPHMENCGYPFQDLAGVGVAFKLVQAVFQKLLPDKIEQTKWMLDLVAIGTIADCVPLLGENRLLVKYGLIVLSKTRRTGLLELFTVGRITMDENSVTDTKKVSFYIAPRINAAGRINHANLAYDLVMENDSSKARGLALELEANNTQRQKITEQVAAEVRVLAQNAFKDKKFIFAVGEHFPVGVVGLVAGKIAQQFNKPTVVFQKGEVESKGSFRSIPQLNIIETIGECKEFLARYGGHSQAAGVSVENNKLDDFYEKMNSLIESKLEGADLAEEIVIDAEIKAGDVGFELTDSLEKLKPFGESNEEPVFLMKNLTVRDRRLVGSTQKHIKLMLAPEGGAPKIFEAISFNGAEKFANIKENDLIDMVFSIQKDEWNGTKKIQFTLFDAKHSNG